jgi:hydroxymethylpyrimidine pyrophosphatase-like HAD family hydrolase
VVERIACPTHWQPEAHAHAVLRTGTVAGARELPALVDRLRDQVGDAVTMQHWGAVTQDMSIGTQTHVLEIFAAGVDKWTMIEHVCGMRGVGTDQVATVGDGLNDLGMLRAAALSISMDNAHEHAHAAAKVRVGHHDRDGFAEAVELVLSHR